MKKENKKIEELKEEVKAITEMRDMFLVRASKKWKAISIMLPLIPQSDMIDLLSELYSRRDEDEKHI